MNNKSTIKFVLGCAVIGSLAGIAFIAAQPNHSAVTPALHVAQAPLKVEPVAAQATLTVEPATGVNYNPQRGQ